MSTEVNIDGLYVPVPLYQASSTRVVPVYGVLQYFVSAGLVSATIFILKLVRPLAVKTESFVIYNEPQADSFQDPGLDVTTWFNGILFNLITGIKSRQEIYSEGIRGFNKALYNPCHAGEVMCAILAFASAFQDLFKWNDLVRMYNTVAGGSRTYRQCYHLITSNFKFFWTVYSAGRCGALWKHYKIFPSGFQYSLMFGTYSPAPSLITRNFVNQVFNYVNNLLADRAIARECSLATAHIKLLSKNKMKEIVKWITEQMEHVPVAEEELEEEEEQKVEVQQSAPVMQDGEQQVNEMKEEMVYIQPDQKQEEKQQYDIKSSQVDQNGANVPEEEFKQQDFVAADYDDENGPDKEFKEEDFSAGESYGERARKRLRLSIDNKFPGSIVKLPSYLGSKSNKKNYVCCL